MIAFHFTQSSNGAIVLENLQTLVEGQTMEHI